MGGGNAYREIGGSTFGYSAQTFRLKASNVASPMVQASEINVLQDPSPIQQKRKEINKRRLQMKGSLLDEVKVDENGKHYLQT